MENIEEELLNFVWDKLEELRSIFSQKAYRALSNYKNNNEKEDFETTLELLLEADKQLRKKIDSYATTPNIENLTIEEISSALNISAYDNFTEKIKYIDRALYFVEKYKKEDKIYATLLNNLASIYGSSKGEDDKAEPLFKKALEIYEKVLGEEHPNTAISYNNLAELYRSKEEYDKAEPLYKKSLEIREKVLGEEHPDIARSYNNLASLYHSKGEYDKAQPLYEKSLRISEKVLGEEHPRIKIIHNNFNIFLEKQNRAFFLNKNNSNYTFKIDKIELNNFKHYSNFSIEFTKKVNIIIGQNAIGKTSLLQAIALGLLKKNIIDARGLEFERFITKGESEATITITHNQDKKKEIVIKKDERVIENNHFIPFVLAYGSNFFTKYDISADKITQNILNETINKEFAHSIFEDYVDEFWNPLTILNELDRDGSEKAKEKSKTLLKTINSFLEEYKIVKEGNYFHFLKDKDDTKLDLENLSEGYRSNVLIITDMVVKILGVGKTPTTIRGIVLIDEFDKHLHPKWQSRLVKQLTDSFPYIQFIMTTHNPMSILDRNPDEITVIREIDGALKAVKGKGTKQIDISVVLLEYFGVDSVIGQSMQDDISNFNRLKLTKSLTQKEQQELDELEEKLSNTIASNFIYDRKYLKFLEFIKEHKDIDFDKFEKIDDEEMDELLKEFGDFFND